MCLLRPYSYKVFRSSSLEGSHLRAHFSLCLRASFSTVLSRPPSLATNRRVTRASSISRFSLVVSCPVPASCLHTRPTLHLAERYTAARLCPICTLTECCLFRIISRRTLTGARLRDLYFEVGLLYFSPLHVPEYFETCLGSTTSFPLLLIELTRRPFVLASQVLEEEHDVP